MCISLSLLCMGCGSAGTPHIIVHEEELDLGLSKEADIIFLADTHISLCDDRDPALITKALERYEAFVTSDGIHSDDIFKEEMAYVKGQSPDLLILGGDVIDSAMYASVDFLKDQIGSLKSDYVYGLGNHDFEYGDEYFSDRAYEEYLPRLDGLCGDGSGYQLREYDEYVIFVVNDENNQIAPDALEQMKILCDGNKPVILCTHVPIEPLEQGSELWARSKEIWGSYDDGRSRVLLGANSCIPNDVTSQFLDLVMQDGSPVVLVMSGHIHFYDKSELKPGLAQIVTGAGFEGELIHLHIK